jgi:hypothetical protein
MEHKVRAQRGIRIGALAVFVFAVSILAADASVTARLRHYGTYLQRRIMHSPSFGCPALPLLSLTR